jgi:hypothetical protein
MIQEMFFGEQSRKRTTPGRSFRLGVPICVDWGVLVYFYATGRRRSNSSRHTSNAARAPSTNTTLGERKTGGSGAGAGKPAGLSPLAYDSWPISK